MGIITVCSFKLVGAQRDLKSQFGKVTDQP